MAYHHLPYMAYGVFAKTLASRYIDEDKVILSLLDTHNPAGTTTYVLFYVQNYDLKNYPQT